MRSVENTSLIMIMLLISLHVRLHWSYAFILLSSSADLGYSRLFQAGTGNSYQIISTIALNEPPERKGSNVGYQIQGDVSVGVLWENSRDKNEKLLEIQLNRPRLLIQSMKETKEQEFSIHKSKLESTQGYPFLIHWKNGKIINVYLDEREDVCIANFKKGIASLFQFQILETEHREIDTSGDCQVIYASIDPHTLTKTKTDCAALKGIHNKKVPDSILSANINSSRTSIYKLSKDLSVIESISTIENHNLIMPIKKEAGCLVSSTQQLTLNGDLPKVHALKSSTLDKALQEFSKLRKLALSKRQLQIQPCLAGYDKEDFPSLPKLLKENREHLSESSLGTFKSASTFVKLLSAARRASKGDLTQAFKGSKNKEILTQLCDLAGAIQSKESHDIIMKLINFDADKDFDKSERYLWALAAGSYPQEPVIRDIFRISQRRHPNEKLDETLVLTLASMAQKFHELPGNENSTLVKEITNSIVGELDVCKDENCKIKYLRALRNLKSSNTIPILLKHALNGKIKVSVEAMKGLRSFHPSFWTDDVIDAAQKIFFQAGKKFDSSSRTLALDILLESNPRREILQELILYLSHYDPMYEVKLYLTQRLKQLSEKNGHFSGLVNSIKNEFRSKLNNYHVQAQRGLTTAFSRNFVDSEYRNGSLSTVLEISKGLLKRGIVEVLVNDNKKSTSLFTLGLFASGLSSFISSEDQDNSMIEDSNDEVTTAGIELTVLGSQIRPFIFFMGTGELMGHIWSGTASEKTPAFQAIILVIDYLENISLQNGFWAEFEILGAVSFDLSGQIQISLWNKNAHSLVEKSAGVSLQGRLSVDSSFTRSKVEFNIASEMKLDLQSDLSFNEGTSLCMQLSQPEVVIKLSTHKTERIPGGKHRSRKSRYSQLTVPGRTYLLNKKNNEMCNKIFN